MTNRRPKIGLALSGSSARLLAHVGVLEVFTEHQIPIDVLVGCSSGALAAVSFATGRMDNLKTLMRQMSWKKFFSFSSFKKTKGGIINFRQAERVFNQITRDLNFEDIKTLKLGITAADLYTGKLVLLTKGSINNAIRASVAMPGLFEPVVIDGKLLVDGGLVNVVPTRPVKDLGADIVIGVHLATANFIYEKRLRLWRWYRFWTKRMATRVVPGRAKKPGAFAVLAKAVEHSFKIDDEWNGVGAECDLMIEPKVKQHGRAQFSVANEVYLEGRRAAEEAIPKIKDLIHEFENRK